MGKLLLISVLILCFNSCATSKYNNLIIDRLNDINSDVEEIKRRTVDRYNEGYETGCYSHYKTKLKNGDTTISDNAYFKLGEQIGQEQGKEKALNNIKECLK